MVPRTAIALLASLASVSCSSVLFSTERTSADCLSYRGRYGATHVHVGSDNCIEATTSQVDSGSIASLQDGVQLLHAQPAVIEGFTASSDWVEELSSLLLRNNERSEGQTVFAAPIRLAELAHVQADRSGAFFAIPDQHFREALLQLDRSPRTVYRLVPAYSLAPAGVPQADRDRIGAYLQNLTFDPEISHIIKAAFEDEKSLYRDATWLSGANSDLRSRHSFTDDVVKAAQWVKEQAEGNGGRYAPECELWRYAPGFGPSVICRYPHSSDATNVVLMAAHLDSRGSFGYARAGGGDDDGSGSTMLLAVARSIRRQRIRFGGSSAVQLVWFTGEEQGLIGSLNYAKRLKDEGVDIKLMVQADMIGYRKPGEPLQLAFPSDHAPPEGTWLAGNLSTIYSPELVVGRTPACCSDHQSFDDLGFTSTWVFERNGPIADPAYHSSQDLVDREGYSFEQLAAIGRVYVRCAGSESLTHAVRYAAHGCRV